MDAYKIAESIYILVCEEGRFGQDCALKCNTTCQGCNNVNGVCDTGCKTGWKGVYCHEGLLVQHYLMKMKNEIPYLR